MNKLDRLAKWQAGYIDGFSGAIKIMRSSKDYRDGYLAGQEAKKRELRLAKIAKDITNPLW